MEAFPSSERPRLSNRGQVQGQFCDLYWEDRMTAAEIEELRFLLILSKMKENAEKLAK
jgi:hypothetical protein